MTLPRRMIGSLSVPVLTLGTAGWGARTDRRAAFGIADAAIELGINFLDTAEGYPAPMSVETHGRSEILLGQWLAKGGRTRALVCSKVYGPSRTLRGGFAARLDPHEISMALDRSLNRLGTECLDLYLIHWPDGCDYDVFLGGEAADRLRAQADAMGRALHAGKIRAWGLSNASQEDFEGYCRAADDVGAPRPAVAQNRFSLWEDPHGMANNPVPLMAYGALNHGRIGPDVLQPALAHVLEQPFTRTCCVGSSNSRHLAELAALAAME